MMTTTSAGISAGPHRIAAGLTASEITVRVVEEADQIPAAEWALLTEGVGFYSSPRWLRMLEGDQGWDTWYLTARDAAGRILAIVPAYLLSAAGPPHGDSHFYSPATALTGPLAPLAPADWRSFLLLGGRCGYETQLLIAPELGPADRRLVLGAVQARAAKLAAAWGISGIAMMHLIPADTATVGAALGRRPVLTEVTSEFDLSETGSFNGLLARLSGHRRRRIHQEIRRFAGGGLRLRWTRLSDAVEQLAPLIASHQQRYGHQETSQQLIPHLAQQADRLDDLSRVLLCERRGVAIGGLLAYEWQGAWYPRIGAAGAGLREQQDALFNLFYYEPISRAIAGGATRYVTGPSSLQTKILRGARVSPRWSVLAGPEDAEAAADSGARWNAARISAWNEELGIELVEPR